MRPLEFGFSIARLISVGLLLWALGRHSYEYYKLLRFIIFVIMAFGIYFSIKLNKIGWTWIFGSIAFLFNPVIPFHFNKSTWGIIDIIVSIIILGSLLFLRTNKDKMEKLK